MAGSDDPRGNVTTATAKPAAELWLPAEALDCYEQALRSEAAPQAAAGR